MRPRLLAGLACTSRRSGGLGQKRASMLGKRYVFTGALLAFVALSLGVLANAASASSTVGLNLTARADYSCVGPCASATTFTVDGVAHPSSGFHGAMTLSAVGNVLSFDPTTNCLTQAENWALTEQNGKDTIFFSTTSDTLCFTANPNVSLETATFTITGGTGRFSDATGGGTFNFTVLTHPQKATGTITGTITY